MARKKKQSKKFKKFKRILMLLIFLLLVGIVIVNPEVRNIVLDLIASSEQDDDHKHNPNEAVTGVTYDDFQMHFLELGNKYTGDSTYIKAGEIDILIDAGSKKSSAETIKAYVDQYCTDGKLEYVIATHAHQDHIAGFVGSSSGDSRTGIFYQYDIEILIDFAFSNATSQLYEEYLEAREMLEGKGTKCYTAEECFNNKNGAKRSYELAQDITMDILYNKFYFEAGEDENDYSVCTMFNYNGHHFMMTGDLEKEGEEALAAYYDKSTPEKTLPHVDLFKAGHHGSKTSSNTCLLKLITPEICTVCCCAGSSEYTTYNENTFPTQEFIDRIAVYTDKVYVTSVIDSNKSRELDKQVFKSLNGNIIVSCNGENTSVKCSNNDTILKDSEWFNEDVYLKKSSNGKYQICSASKQPDYYNESDNDVIKVKRRTWPTN
jgi:beta-lactamase superfamily II metal-dependent hydrolase